MHLKNIFVCTLNLHVSNDDNFFLKARSENRSGQKMDVENDIFWSDIGSGFDEPGSTPPTKNSQEYSPGVFRCMHIS